MRTIVFSDVHGEPDVIRSVVAHSGFKAGADRLVFAGDAIEVGRDSEGALDLLEELGAEFLVGNHEYALFVDGPLEYEQLGAEAEATVLDRIGSGEWALVSEAGGVLITHAGLSQSFAEQFAAVTAQGTVADFAAHLNEEFREAIGSRDLVLDGVCGRGGPLWYRPRGGVAPLRGVMQVAGHTPVSLLHAQGEAERLADAGMHLIDPHVRRWRALGFPPPPPLRYAVIEGGAVRVFSG
jgi:hypothetical protein